MNFHEFLSGYDAKMIKNTNKMSKLQFIWHELCLVGNQYRRIFKSEI